MKKLLLTFFFGVVLCGPLVSIASAADGGYMMIISRVSLGFDAQASVVTIMPDGTQQVKAIDFSRFSAKQMASNMTEVDIARELVEMGIPREDIVLGLHPPYKRPYTGYGVA